MYSRLRFDREAESYARRAVRAARALRDLPRRAQSLARCSEILGAVPQLATVAKATVVTALAAARAIPVDDASDSSTEATVGVVVERYAALATAEELEVLYAELGEWRRRWPSVTALLAVGLARAGSVPRALRVLDEVSADRRETTLHDIGCKLVEQERLDDARELTKRIESAWARADILARAAQEYAKLGRSAVAAEVALLAISVSETIAPGAGSVAMAVGIGTALRDVGDMDGGRRIAGEALRTLLPLNPYNAIYVDLAPAVDALIEADAFEDAYDLATIVGALAGYMVDQTPGLSEQSRALVLAARGWRHSNQTSKLREVVSRIASLSASVDPQYSSGDEVEAMLALVRILDIAGQTGAAIDAARATMARAFRIGSGNDPRIPLLGELIDTLIVLDQLSLAREAARKILEALAERDKDSPWWRHDRAIVARALGLVGMREQGLEIAQQLLAEARTAPVVLGAEEFYLPTIVETLGAPALDDLKVLWRDAARLPRMDQRARALTLLALSLHRIRKQDDALECLRQAFESERRAGNSSTLQMLGWTAPILAQHDGGVLLREIHERFCRFRDVLAPRR